MDKNVENFRYKSRHHRDRFWGYFRVILGLIWVKFGFNLRLILG